MTRSIVFFSTLVFLLLTGCEGISNQSNSAAGKTPEIIFKSVEPQEFSSLIGKKEVVLIDANSEKEFKEGHIKGARNIDFFSPKLYDEVETLDKTKTYLIYARRDHRKDKVMDAFRTVRIFKLIGLKGGLEAWKAAGLPVEK